MNNLPAEARILKVPRAEPEQGPLELNMSVIDEAERRMHEVRLVSNVTQRELQGLFNEAANHTGKYMAWVEYEILKATKLHNRNRSAVILGKAISEAVRLKETGIKMNEDMREALISQDADCEKSLDILNSLKAVKLFLEGKHWSFIRSHSSIAEVANNRGAAPTPNFVGTVGQTFNAPQTNLLGKDERKDNG